MIKVEVIESFTLGRFNELRNIIRANKERDVAGELAVGDMFECTEDMAGYLLNEKNSIYLTDKDGKNNPSGRAFVKKIEVIPEEKKQEEVKEEKPKKTTRRKTTKKAVEKKD